MLAIIAFGLALAGIAALILPWVNRSSIKALRKEVEELKLQLRFASTSNFSRADTTSPSQQIHQNSRQHTEIAEKAEQIIPDNNITKTYYDSGQSVKALEPQKTKPEPIQSVYLSSTKYENKHKAKESFEERFGARMPVWIGGVAMALAGFFLVKYSIDIGLLTPAVRVVLGIIFGIGLLYAGHFISKKPSIANNIRISQSLIGAGIADLYICLFAATSMYELVHLYIGFAGMMAVTVTAVLLSIRHGMPVAILGMLGGFLTPAMVGAHNPQAPFLFIYLYFMITGLMVVIRKECWWMMSIPTVLGGLLWVILWLFGGHFTPDDSIWLGLFLIAVSATVVVTSKQQFEDESADITDAFKITTALNYLTLGGAILIMGVIAAEGGFNMLDWGLFALLSIGGLALAFFNQKLYGVVPWISMAVNLVMIFIWNAYDEETLAIVILLFGTLFIVSGYAALQSHSKRPLAWAGFSSAASLGYYLIGYYKLHDSFLLEDVPLFWGALALLLAIASLYVVQKVLNESDNAFSQKQHVLAVCAATCTAFVSVALTIELPYEFLSVAIAAQLLAISWINTRVDISALRYIAAILAGLFAFLLIPQILLLVQLSAYSLVEAKLRLQEGVPIVDWPLFQLGLPALCFIAGSYLLRLQRDDKLVSSLEVAAIALFGVMGYYLTRHAFHADQDVLFIKAGFIERGVITNIIFAYGLLTMWLGRKYSRNAVGISGIVLSGIALFRICYFDLFIYNPLWSHQAVGSVPVFNFLLLTYGLPVFLIYRLVSNLQDSGYNRRLKYGYGLMLVLAFALITLQVRQLYHGEFLNTGITDNAEIYTYSVVWLVFGLAILFMGTLRHDKMMRIASLAIMILTVGKVFLFDASELEGLFRVFSFFGLGLSLLGLSWFYTRFVFSEQSPLARFQKTDND